MLLFNVVVKVKRRKVEEVEIGVDSLDNPAEEKSKCKYVHAYIM